MNKKVLVTVSGGVPTIYADHDVDAVVLDYDNAKDTHPDDMIPIHLEYLPLMKFAKAIGHWPLTDDGRINDAKNLPDTTWKLLSKERPPISVCVECVMKPEFANPDISPKKVRHSLETRIKSTCELNFMESCADAKLYRRFHELWTPGAAGDRGQFSGWCHQF